MKKFTLVFLIFVCVVVVFFLVNWKIDSTPNKSLEREAPESTDQAVEAIPATETTRGELGDNKPSDMIVAMNLEEFMWIEESSLSSALIVEIKNKMRPAFEESPNVEEYLTKTSVLPYIGHSISMAFPPVVGTEIEGYFLLSGGTKNYLVDDFSSGIAVDYSNGQIYLWNGAKLNYPQ